MIFVIAILVLILIAFACAVVVDIKLEARLDRVDKEIELLLKNDSQLSMNATRLDERINMQEDKNKELNKKLDDIENRVTANVAKKVEQRWDAGLEKMMAWNPYDIGNGDGGN